MRTLLVTMVLAATCQAALAAPEAYSPALALYHADAADNASATVQVSITGADLGTPQSGTFAVADCGTAAGGAFVVVYADTIYPVFTARSTVASEVSDWNARQIVLRLTSSVGAQASLSAVVCTPAGKSATAAIAKWVYEHVDVPISAGTNAVPLAIARDASGQIWLNEEFHNQVKRYGTAWTSFAIPQVAGPGIFAWNSTTFGDVRTRTSILGEDVIVDPLGRVWFSESGSAPYTGVHPNHSRILMYDPVAQQLRTLNVPGDRNGVFGLSWDPLRKRIWFTQTRRALRNGFVDVVAQRARLTSFDPLCVGNPWCNPATPNYNVANWSSVFDYDAEAATWTCQGGSTSPAVVGTCQNAAGNNGRSCFTAQDCALSGLVCAPGYAYDYWCFHDYELPDSDEPVTAPAHVLAHSDGTIFYSAYWGGNHLGRLNQFTGTVQRYPLPDPPDQASCAYESCDCFFDTPNPPCPARCCQYLLLGSGPWSVLEESSGNVAMSYQTYPAIGRFDYARANDPACQQLDGAGQNPCFSFYEIPTFDPATQFTHSAALDGNRNLWLSVAQSSTTDCSKPTSVGFLQVNTNRMLMFPPLSFYPLAPGGGCTPFSGNGMAYDTSSGGMWFTDFLRKRLGRIRPQ